MTDAVIAHCRAGFEVECVADGPVAVMVKGTVPGEAPLPTVSVRVELSPELIEGGLKAAVIPDGMPVAVRVSGCGLPDVTAVLTV